MMACLRLMSCPSRHLFVGTPTSNAHTEGTGSTAPSDSFLAFQLQKVPHPSVVRLWGSVLHQCSDLLFSVFRRMVTCSTRFFLTCQPIRTTIRLENSSWQMLLSITPASTVCVSFSRDWMSPMWCVTCHTNERAAETIGIAILSCRSDAIHCSCFDIHLPHSHNDALCRFGPCTPRA